MSDAQRRLARRGRPRLSRHHAQFLDTAASLSGPWRSGSDEGALEMALRYAKDRAAFAQSRSPTNCGAIQFMLADAKKDLDAAELLIHRAASARGSGADRSPPKPRSPSSSRARWRRARLQRLTAKFTAATATRDSVDVERHLRTRSSVEIGEGTSQVQRMVIARGASPQVAPSDATAALLGALNDVIPERRLDAMSRSRLGASAKAASANSRTMTLRSKRPRFSGPRLAG